MPLRPLPAGDTTLVQILDAAFADSARRSGEWLLCSAGCAHCCVGVFAINSLDTARLQHGLAVLEAKDPERAASIRERARASIQRIAKGFPGNKTSGVLDTDEKAEERFEEFANDEPCPVLDRATGRCELYEWRPMTCRIFGPPVQTREGLGVCELCFHGATNEQIASCEMRFDVEQLESELIQKLEKSGMPNRQTIVAYAVSGEDE